jgi:hypothetical protein
MRGRHLHGEVNGIPALGYLGQTESRWGQTDGLAVGPDRQVEARPNGIPALEYLGQTGVLLCGPGRMQGTTGAALCSLRCLVVALCNLPGEG